MCIFSADVDQVSSTRIFSRVEGGTQYLAYEMIFNSLEDVAMVLPIPIEEAGRADGIKFINLSDYDEFFSDLDACFPTDWGGIPDDWYGDTLSLEVHEVGSFHASYVPSVDAFARIDERFRLSPSVLESLHEQRGFAFVVFQFRPGHQKSHPMAFMFPSAKPERVYFPTTHIHDSMFHSQAEFDHVLFVQKREQPSGPWAISEIMIATDESSLPTDSSPFLLWDGEESRRRQGVKIGRAKGLISADLPVCRWEIKGHQDNSDIWA